MSTTQQPTAPAVQQDPTFSNIYTLYYRHGLNHPISLNFRFSGGLKDAIERAKQHCSKMGYRFQFVAPFIINLDKEEAKNTNMVEGTVKIPEIGTNG